MSDYLEIKDFLDLSQPRITHEEEIRLAVSIQNNFIPFKHRRNLSNQEKIQFRKGCRDREKLILSNVRLIKGVVKRFEISGIEMRILLDFGMTGLILATESFDPYKINPKSNQPFKFSTHATWQILKEASIGVNKYRTIRIPQWVLSSLSTLKKVKTELERSLGRKPSDLEILGRMPTTGKFKKSFTQERLDFIRETQFINDIRSIDSMTIENDEGSSVSYDIRDPFDIWESIELEEELKTARKIKSKKRKSKRKKKRSNKRVFYIKDFSKKMRSGHQLGLQISIKVKRNDNAKRKKIITQDRPIGINKRKLQQLTLDLEVDSILNFPQFDRGQYA
jgi:DNA-directed RNA polymerase specialized sigma subunit